MKKITLLLVVAAMALTASAYDFMVNGIAYNYLNGSMGSEVEVTYTTNSALNYGDTLYYAHIPTKVTYVGRTYSVTAVGNSAFTYCKHIRSVNVPYSVKSIGSSAFRGCTMLSTATIGDYVTSIGDYAFRNCSSLATVSIGSSVTSIGKEAFQGCSGMASVTIPNSVTSIGEKAFYNCQGLTSLTIGNSVTSIGKWAFYDCRALTSIKSKIIDVGSVSMGDAVFGGVSTTSCVLKIPIGTYDIYRQTSQWKDFKNIQEGVVSNILVNSITLNRTSATMDCNTNWHLQLTATVRPVDADNRTVFWSSDNTSVATVNPIGEVFAVSPGVAHIKARAQDGSGVSATCTITVESQLVESITLNRTSAAIYDGQTLQLTATVSPENADNKTLAWTSNNSSIASVDNNGLVTAHSPGTAYINATATDGSNVTARCIVVVTPQLVESITLNNTEVSLFKGNTYQLTATVLPNNASNKSVTWTSSNTNVATVSSSGLVTAKSPGNATIIVTAQDGSGVSARCAVTVNAQLATGITLNQTSATLNNGETLQLTATVTPSNANNTSVTWKSSNTSVATVSSNGLVTAKGRGTVTITATTADGSNLSAQCTITVNQLATGISLNQTSATINKGETLQLTATVTPSNANNTSVTWKSSNTNIATVSNAGLVTAKAVGNATITATTADGSNLSATCVITVNSGSQPATGISLNKTSATLNNGETLQLTATVTPSNASSVVTWTSSKTSVATVSSSGLVTAKGPGTATIKATTADGTNLSASCVVIVNQPVTGITISKTSATVTAGNTLQLTYSVTPSNATNKAATWSSSNTNIATVSSSGLVTAKALGTATITVTTADGSNLSASCIVTVTPQLATGITLSQTSATLNNGETLQLTATVTPSNTTNKSITWKSSNTNIATVSNAGLVTAKAVGNATITATTADGSNLSATCEITVNSGSQPATGISLNKTSATINNGETLQLTATVTPSDASSVVTWTSSKTSVATVSSSGLVTAKGPGTATIKATTADGTNLSATCKVTVVQPVTSITINNTSATVEVGNTLQLTYSVTPSNASNKAATWSSSNTNIATVSSSGLVTAKAPGTATITVTTADGSNLSASCIVTVTDSSHLQGDVDGNGNVDGTDLNILINIILGKDNAANYDGRANVDGNGGVDGTDLNTLINIILGK